MGVLSNHFYNNVYCSLLLSERDYSSGGILLLLQGHCHVLAAWCERTNIKGPEFLYINPCVAILNHSSNQMPRAVFLRPSKHVQSVFRTKHLQGHFFSPKSALFTSMFKLAGHFPLPRHLRTYYCVSCHISASDCWDSVNTCVL